MLSCADEGIQVSHPDLAAHIWVNPEEIANNRIDDDGNGYKDDVCEFPVSHVHLCLGLDATHRCPLGPAYAVLEASCGVTASCCWATRMCMPLWRHDADPPALVCAPAAQMDGILSAMMPQFMTAPSTTMARKSCTPGADYLPTFQAKHALWDTSLLLSWVADTACVSRPLVQY